MALRLLTLQRDDECARCTTRVPAHSRAWWDRYARAVVCVICEPVRTDDPLPPPAAIERTTARADVEPTPAGTARAGSSSTARGPNVVGRLMRSLAHEPTTSTAVARDRRDERRLARLLDTELTDAVAMHDRRLPATRGGIDHVVVAPSGVWLIEARRLPSEVAYRPTGAFGTGTPRLLVDGRDEAASVTTMRWPAAAMRAQLEAIGAERAPVQPVVCFTSAAWPRRSEPVEIDDVLVTWPWALLEAIDRGGPLDALAVVETARHLASVLERRPPDPDADRYDPD